MTDEEVRRRLVELVEASLFRHIDKSCLLSENIVNDLLKNGVTIREHGEWKDNHCTVCGMTPIGEETWTYYGLTPPKFEQWMGFCPICGADLLSEEIWDETLRPRKNIKFETGDIAKIVGNTTEHGFEIGTIVRLEKCKIDYKAFVGDKFWWVVDDDLEPIEDANIRG